LISGDPPLAVRGKRMDVNSVLLMVLLVVVLLISWWLSRKLWEIHRLVNSRLSEALQTIEDLKGLLVEDLDTQNPRIKQAIAKNS
jgi:hypothetical protein